MNERDQLIRPIFVICVSNQLYKEIAEITVPSSVGDNTTLVRGRRLGVRRVRRVLLDATNEIERGVKRLVVLRIRRDIGLRAGLLVAFGLEVSAQRSFAARVSARFELLRHLLQYLDVGRDALRLDRAAGGGEVTCGGQPKRPIAGAERSDGLHRALAERARKAAPSRCYGASGEGFYGAGMTARLKTRSRSRIRYRGASFQGNASVIWHAIQSAIARAGYRSHSRRRSTVQDPTR